MARRGRDLVNPKLLRGLKDHFRRLNFVAISSRKVVHVWKTFPPDYEAMIAGVQEIYSQHGWPDLERYDKNKCLKAVTKFIKEQYHQYKP